MIYTRLKSPFYGCQGFMSGKVDFGEKVINSAKRELKEESNLEGNPEIVALKHYLVYDKISKTLLEDKFMFLCIVKEPKGILKQSEEGKYEWVKESELKSYVTNHFESWTSFINIITIIKYFDGVMKFIEEDHYSEKF